MAFFTSEYEIKLDAKGRLTLPAKLKSGLPESNGSELVLRRGFEQCLILYPMTEWKKIYQKIVGLNEFNEEHRKLQRNFFRGNSVVELDSSGRILIPKPMMSFANLDREVVMVGVGNKIELWNPDVYNNYLIDDQQEFSDLAGKYLDTN
ncbi:division/cell wall cluster transcriptional repressor MraZ [Marinigracilibium pacificum]|uniref:Transcriptional regulator MraZ n=1 Tax=Marinigracilibium pacificum TaxID=2729599 RepID=A0A848J3J3_9BACT|nr:division/cell wall cluster transcriptional repressor MraZ [Marinigracilibium pacificum]NMM50075.1 division/cell wall cluster transcriptional repressor MraZ [Marinigracilibium pacificum]